MELLRVIITVSIFAAVQGQLANTTQIDGGPFTVTCDPTRLTIPQAATTIYALSIERILYTSPQPQLIATYQPYELVNTTKTIPPNRQWVITAQGNSKATVKLELLVLDGTCADAGVYRCNATFTTTPAGSTAYNTQNITGKAKTEDLMITLNLHNGNDPYFSENEPGQNVTLTCSVRGPQRGLTLTWMYAPTNGMPLTEYPTKNDIKENYPITAVGADLCVQARYESVLSIVVESQETMYVCVVKDNNNEVMQRNFTIGNIPATDAPSAGGSSEPTSDANVGAIVGGVIGGLVLIAIIVIVVYFCWYRKRNDDETDRSKEIGVTDTTHAPPPVFYAEPKKAKKDERDGVRPDKGFTNEALDNSYDDSKDHRGPPQYINTVDGEDLPRYEKETHRGRSNRGYEDENEKNEGRGHRHRRDRKDKDKGDKEDRDDRRPPRKDCDDRDKGRHYSTDDGTDNRDPQMGYGDPNMGTSI